MGKVRLISPPRIMVREGMYYPSRVEDLAGDTLATFRVASRINNCLEVDQFKVSESVDHKKVFGLMMSFLDRLKEKYGDHMMVVMKGLPHISDVLDENGFKIHKLGSHSFIGNIGPNEGD